MLRRTLIPITLLLTVASLCVSSSSFALTKEEKTYLEKHSAAIEKVKKEFGNLKGNGQQLDEEKLMPTPQELKEAQKFKSLTEHMADVSKFKKLGENPNLKAVENIFENNNSNENWLNIDMALNKSDKKNLIFYLFSTSVPAQTVKNVFMASKRYKNLEFYGVLRGIDRKTLKYISSLDQAMDNMTVKINPIIFRKVGAKVVPAFVIADCPDRPGGIIRAERCKYKAVLYGDVSLHFAIKKFKEDGLWKK